MAKTILCAGIAVLDDVFAVARFPEPQAKARAEFHTAVVGGCAANAAITVARLGGLARLAAPLGGPAQTDVVGDRILAELRREDVDCSGIVRVPGAVSPHSAVLVDAAGERIIVNHRDNKLEGCKPLDAASLTARADAVLVDNRFPDFVLPICNAARRRGIPVILDGDKPTDQTDALLTLSTHIVFSAEGLRATVPHHSLSDALVQIGKHTRAFLAVTDGAHDILWLLNGNVQRHPVFAIEAVDTLGAGDVFHAAFALRIAEGVGEIEALRFAAAAAAIKCTRLGGGSGAPSRREVQAFLEVSPAGGPRSSRVALN